MLNDHSMLLNVTHWTFKDKKIIKNKCIVISNHVISKKPLEGSSATKIYGKKILRGFLF